MNETEGGGDLRLLDKKIVADIVARVALENDCFVEVEQFKKGMILVRMEAILKYETILKYTTSVTIETRFTIAVGSNIVLFTSTLEEYMRLAVIETRDSLAKFLDVS